MPRTAVSPAQALLATAVALALAACTAVAGTPGATPASGNATPGATHDHGHASETGYREPVWEAVIGAEMWSSPALLGDVVVVGANDGKVYGLDVATGEQQWAAPIGAAVRATPLVAGGLAYILCDAGWVHALNSEGDEAWRAGVGPSTPTRDDWDGYGSRPAERDGVVYAATASGVVAALDAATGAQVWRRELDKGVQADLALGDDVLHVSTMGGGHLALDLADGAEVWRAPGGGEMTTSPLVVDELVLVGSRGATLQALADASGEKAWAASFGSSWVQSGPTELSPGTVVIGSSDYQAVRALELTDGSDQWLTRVTGWPWGVPAVADGVVYQTQIMAPQHEPWGAALYALSADDGSELWVAGGGQSLSWRPDGAAVYGAATRPLIARDLVILSGLDGVVRAYER